MGNNLDAEKMQNCKLAFCVPTCNRSTIVAEFLEKSALKFHHLGIDIFYYDSSTDEKTKLVVEKWRDIYKNISFIHVPSNWHANHKVIQIFKQYALEQPYDYIWICGDAIQYDDDVLEQVLDKLNLRYDMLIVNGRDEEQIGSREYTDGNELFYDCAWHMTLFGAVILNVHTMFQNVPWEELENKYEIPERINFSHVGFYFEMIYRLKRFRAFHLSVNRGIYNSRLKRAPGWAEDAFSVLCEYWPSTIEALPPFYTNKKEVINKHGYYAGLTPGSFLWYRRENIYNGKVLGKYKEILKDMSSLNLFQLWSLAYLNPKLAYFIATKDIRKYIREVYKIFILHIFCKKNQQIYIYGAGMAAERYGKYLQKKGIVYQGFLVTQKDEKTDMLLGHPVLTLYEYMSTHKKGGIIIGMNQKNTEEVQPLLQKFDLWKDTYHDYIMPVMLENWSRKKAGRTLC